MSDTISQVPATTSFPLTEGGGEGVGKPKTIAFFGATGGSTLAALTRALKAGYTCSALVRTPAKLRDLLDSHDIKAPENLTVHTGDVTDQEAVTRALSPTPDVIIFGVGGVPKYTSNPLKPISIDQPTLCQDGIAAVLGGLKTLNPAKKPSLVAISTTGTDAKRDIPLLMVPLYHWLLEIPHIDKRAMEERIEAAEKEGTIRGFIIVKPSLLVNGAAKPGSTRAGYDGRTQTGSLKWGDVQDIAIGYTISREDVGNWIFEEVVQRDGGEWVGKKVSLTW